MLNILRSIRATYTLKLVLEIVLVAFVVVLVSWYWSVDEHVVFIPLFAAAGLIFIERWDPEISNPKGNLSPLVFYILFLGWLVLSTLWSGVFHLSLSYAILAVLVALTGLLLGFFLPIGSTLAGVFIGVSFVLGHGILTDGDGIFGFFKDSDLQRESNAIMGLFNNSSSAAFLIGLGFVALIAISARSVLLRIFTVLLAILFIFLAVNQEGLTTLVSMFAALIVLAMVFHLRRSSGNLKKYLGFAYAISVTGAAALFWFFREPILRPIGEGPDLSGRTILWDWYFEAFLWRPVIGAGWGNTVGWPPLQPDRLEPVKEFFPAHNGFIDIGLALGGVGVLLVVVTLAMLFIAGVKRASDKRYSLAYLFVPALVVYLSLNDLMATSLPRFIGLFLMGAMVGIVLKQPELHFEHVEKAKKSELNLEL